MILQQEFDPAVTSLCVAARCLREAARGNFPTGGLCVCCVCVVCVRVCVCVCVFLGESLPHLIFLPSPLLSLVVH